MKKEALRGYVNAKDKEKIQDRIRQIEGQARDVRRIMEAETLPGGRTGSDSCALIVLYDVFGRGYRQRVGAVEAVWSITAVYSGPLRVWAYHRYGRPRSKEWQKERGKPPERSLPVAAATGATPCAAASFLARPDAVPLVILLCLTIAGADIWPMIILIAVLALPLLGAFEYFSSSVPGRSLSPSKGLGVALLIAATTVVAFDFGMGFGMVFVHFVLMFPPPRSPSGSWCNSA